MSDPVRFRPQSGETETKNQKFRRRARARTNRVLAAFAPLHNLSGPNYESALEERRQIINARCAGASTSLSGTSSSRSRSRRNFHSSKAMRCEACHGTGLRRVRPVLPAQRRLARWDDFLFCGSCGGTVRCMAPPGTSPWWTEQQQRLAAQVAATSLASKS